MVDVPAQLGHLSVLNLGEGGGEAILAGPTLNPLAVLGTHTEHWQL